MAIDTETYLDTCKQLIETQLNWGSSEGWVNEDFENLSDDIEEKTQVRLSVSTLKRIWGKVQYNSQPTAATLNALAKFAGFENWRAFQQKIKPQEQPAEMAVAPPVTEYIPSSNIVQHVTQHPPKKFRIKRLLVAASVVAVVIVSLSLVSVFKPAKNTAAVNAAAQFALRKTSDGLPNSVVFDYNASAFHTDSVYLQQDWDASRREKLPPNGRQVTSIYYYPGYFNAKLVVDGQVKKESPVFIQTRGWQGIIEQQQPMPVYLSANEIKLNGAIGITAEKLTQKTGSPVFNHTFVHFANVRPLSGTSSADFTLESTVRNSSTVEQSLCRKVYISLVCTHGTFFFPLCDKGCIADVNIMAGKNFIAGKTHDLSAFGCDMKQFQQFACTVHNKRLQVTLNGKLIFDIEQPSTAGEIVGIHYTFEGAGEVKDVKLASAGKTVYQEKF